VTPAEAAAPRRNVIALLAAVAAVAVVAVAAASPGQVVQATVDGMRFGLVIALSGVGLSLIFATTGLFNFAHGEFVTFGAVLAWVGNVAFGLPLVVAAAIAVLGGAAAGATVEYGIWRPLRRHRIGLVTAIVVSIGLAMFSRHLILFFFHGQARSYQAYTVQQAWRPLGIELLPKDLATMVVALAVLVGLGLFLKRSRTGQAVRATADDPDLAQASGIATDRVVLLVWALGGALAALGGVVLALDDQVSWDMGFRVLLLVIAGVTLGGLGTVRGAIVGGLIIGVVTQLSTLWAPSELKYVFALVALVAILIVRPQGIFGRAQRVG
jgi:branched-chain amino acid transport system permease protein